MINDNSLTERQSKFCTYYVELANGKQAAIKAGYSERTAEATASRLLRNNKVHDEITRIREKKLKGSIATGQQVMEFFTRVMNGEEKDQFGLDISASDRLRAAQELAKRTIDLDNKLAGQADNKIEISLKWE